MERNRELKQSPIEQLADIPGVKSVAFNSTADHYQDGAALFSVTYDGEAAKKAAK